MFKRPTTSRRLVRLVAASTVALGLAGAGLQTASASHFGGPTSLCSPTPTPSISIADDFAYEHQNSVQAVTLSNTSCSYVRVDYQTFNWSAVAGSDYVAESGTLWFSPGSTTRHVVIDLIDDTQYENNEHFYVRLSNPVGGTLADSLGWVTISGLEPAG